MPQFTRILCPIDFSEASARALTYATTLTRTYGAELEVLHAPAVFAEGAPAPSSDSGDDLPHPPDQLAVAITRAVSAAGGADLPVRTLVKHGRAHRVIVDHAEAWPADLLVMGTHGRSGFNRLLLGSVTEKVLRLVACPVLTVPPAAPSGGDGPIVVQRILCAVDFAPASLAALHYALDLGRQVGASVTLLHAVEYADPDEHLEPSVFDPGGQARADSRVRRERLLEQARRKLREQLVQDPTTWGETETLAVVDRAYKAILRRAAESRADLIVMGAQGAGGLELMLFGSNTEHVVRSAPCPVLTLRG